MTASRADGETPGLEETGEADGSSPTLAADGTASEDRPAADAPSHPARIGRFEISGELGAGGMGVVYLARDPSLGRKVAIKLLRADRSDSVAARGRLQREARALASLSHPNVVVVHEVGVHEGQVYLVMEHVDGVTLRRWAADHRDDWRAIVAQYRAAGEGLAAAHRAGIIHRDFKPDNVLVDVDGRPRVLDFGLAAPGSSPETVEEISWDEHDGVDLTRTGAILGTPAYMAPEQFLGGTTDARTDQFAFCVSLWEALFGRRPFRGSDLAELRQRVIEGQRSRPSRRAAVPRPILDVIARGLATDPDDRFPTMAELLQGLESPRPTRRGGRAAIAAVALLSGVGTAVWLGWSPSPTEAPSSSAPAPAEVAPPPPDAETRPVTPPPVLSVRPLTHTSGIGVLSAIVDATADTVLYRNADGMWQQPLRGGRAQPFSPPQSDDAAIQLGPDGSYWAVRRDRIDRVWTDGSVEHVADLPGQREKLILPGASSPDRWSMVLADATGFERRDLSAPAAGPVRFELGGPPWALAWSPTGDRIAALVQIRGSTTNRIDIFDLDGRLRSSTGLPSEAIDGLPHKGLVWTDTGIVVILRDRDVSWMQCLSVTDAGVVPGPRSAPLQTSQLTGLVGATRDGTLVLDWADPRTHLVVLDRSTRPARVLEDMPDLATGHNDLVWRSETSLAFFPASPAGSLAAFDPRAPHAVQPLVAGPLDWATSDGAGGLVVGAVEAGFVEHLPRRGPTRRLELPVPVTQDLVIDCHDPRNCLAVSMQGSERVVFDLDLVQEEMRRRFSCPVLHDCKRRRWAWSHDGEQVLLIDQAQQRLSRLDAHTGALLGEIDRLPSRTVQSVTETAQGEVLVTGMYAQDASGQETGPTYSVGVAAPGEPEFRALWGSERTWVVQPRASPSGRYLAMYGLTVHADLATVELGPLCEGS